MKSVDFEALFEASPDPYVLLAPDFTIVAMNEAYLQVTRRARDELVGRNMFDAFPSWSSEADESRARLRESLSRVVATGVPDHLALIHYNIPHPNGGFEERFWSATHTPLKAADGNVVFVLQHTVDVTELHRLRTAARTYASAPSSGPASTMVGDVLRRAEAVEATNRILHEESQQLRRWFQQAPGLIAVLSGPDHIFELANAAYSQLVGNRALVGRSAREALPEMVGQGYLDLLDRVYASGQPFVGRSMPVLVQRGAETQESRYLDFVFQPITDAAGRVTGVFVQGHDITEQKRAEEALARSHRQMREILESISDAFYAVDHAWRFTYINRKAEELWHCDGESLIGQVLWEVFPHAVGSESHTTLLRAARERQMVRFETLSPVVRSWIEVSVYPSETGLSVYFRDVSERRRQEQHMQLMINELNHRVKNSLAVVQALATQTLRNGDTVARAREAFTARLMALAHAHDLLTRQGWEGAHLEEVITTTLAPHLDGAEGRLTLNGPAVRLPPKTALSLSMALHELATNASKYGALANDSGKVTVIWQVTDGLPPRLAMRWQESGGPPVKPPERKGFGSRLIERGLAAELGGDVRLHFEPSGVICTIDAPMPGHHERT